MIKNLSLDVEKLFSEFDTLNLPEDVEILFSEFDKLLTAIDESMMFHLDKSHGCGHDGMFELVEMNNKESRPRHSLFYYDAFAKEYKKAACLGMSFSLFKSGNAKGDLFWRKHPAMRPSEVVLDNIRQGKYNASSVRAFCALLTPDEKRRFNRFKQTWTAYLQPEQIQIRNFKMGFIRLTNILQEIDESKSSDKYDVFFKDYRLYLRYPRSLFENTPEKKDDREFFNYENYGQAPSKVVLNDIRLGRYDSASVAAFYDVLTLDQKSVFLNCKKAWTVDLQRSHQQSEAAARADYYLPFYEERSTSGASSSDSLEWWLPPLLKSKYPAA